MTVSSSVSRIQEPSISKMSHDPSIIKSTRELSISKSVRETSIAKSTNELSSSKGNYESMLMRTSREPSISKINHEESTFKSRINRANSIIGATSIIASSIFDNREKYDYKTYFTTIKKQAEKFSENFIGNDAIYEINIQNSITKEIKEMMATLLDDQNTDLTVEEKVDEFYILFDKAYKEVTNNIYLNSYSNYIHKKNKEKQSKNGGKASK